MSSHKKTNKNWDVKRSTNGKARFSCLRLSNSSFFRFLLPGQLEINLNKMPKPAKNARRCGLHQLPAVGEHSKRNVETVSLFDLKRTNGWWPAVGTDDGEQILAVRHSIYVTHICIHSRSRETLGLVIERVNNFHSLGCRLAWEKRRKQITPTVCLFVCFSRSPFFTLQPNLKLNDRKKL